MNGLFIGVQKNTIGDDDHFWIKDDDEIFKHINSVRVGVKLVDYSRILNEPEPELKISTK